MATTRVKLKPVILSLVVIAGVEVAMGMLAAQSFSTSLAVSGAGRIIEAMMVLLIFRCQPNGLAAIGLSYATLPIGLRHGLIWSLGMGFAVFVGFILLFALGVDALAWFSLHLPGGFSEQVIFFLVAGVISPVAEELFFRGILFGYCRRWGFGVALIISAVAFTAAHLYRNSFPVTQAIGGVIFALAYEKANSIAAPVIIHILGNLAIFTLSIYG